jgi:C4-type Zn-finger protein
MDPSLQKVMEITKCPHTHRKHYAKNMCSSCYRKYGRNQTAWACPHRDRLLYSMGMCQTCYLSDYHKRKVTTALKAEEEAILTMSNAGTNINEDQDKDCSSSDDESSAPL